MIATLSNLDLQVNAITTMCHMIYVISSLTHENLITVTEIVRKSSCTGTVFFLRSIWVDYVQVLGMFLCNVIGFLIDPPVVEHVFITYSGTHTLIVDVKNITHVIYWAWQSSILNWYSCRIWMISTITEFSFFFLKFTVELCLVISRVQCSL